MEPSWRHHKNHGSNLKLRHGLSVRFAVRHLSSTKLLGGLRDQGAAPPTVLAARRPPDGVPPLAPAAYHQWSSASTPRSSL
jgi:hypothetical protein